MSQDLKLENKIFIELDSAELTQAQIRTIKTLNHLLQHVLTTESESEYFDNSAEAIRICASLIKQANFLDQERDSSIPYEEQALEFSLDVLQEHMTSSKVVSYDN
jgi:hypothetical protein